MSKFSAVASEDPLRLHPPLSEPHKATGKYVPATGLLEAADVAMLLGLPLLLSGPPGTGKTRAAFWLATELGAPRPLRFDVKSTTTGTDLLYHFDEVSRFRDSTRQVVRPLTHYLRFNALGEAILRAAGGSHPLEIIGGGGGDAEDDLRVLDSAAKLSRHEELLSEAFGRDWQPTDNAARTSDLLPHDEAFARSEGAQLVVLIDELDKAPRDTPNDLLMEVDEMRFAIPELGLAVRANPEARPVVVITTNAEKSLPEPFLRRCAFFDIPFPKPDDLEIIVTRVLGDSVGGSDLVADVLAIFEDLRSPANEIGRAPGTAELLAWIDILWRQPGVDQGAPLTERIRPNEPVYGLGILLKTQGDQEVGERLIRQRYGGRPA